MEFGAWADEGRPTGSALQEVRNMSVSVRVSVSVSVSSVGEVMAGFSAH